MQLCQLSLTLGCSAAPPSLALRGLACDRAYVRARAGALNPPLPQPLPPSAALTQALVRSRRARAQYLRLRKAALTVQSEFREFLRERKAARVA